MNVSGLSNHCISQYRQQMALRDKQRDSVAVVAAVELESKRRSHRSGPRSVCVRRASARVWSEDAANASSEHRAHCRRARGAGLCVKPREPRLGANIHRSFDGVIDLSCAEAPVHRPSVRPSVCRRPPVTVRPKCRPGRGQMTARLGAGLGAH